MLPWRALHTMRVRLAGAVSAPVALQTVQPPDAQPQQPAQMGDAGRVSLVLCGNELKVELADVLLDDLDYWEVDPDWDGKIFHSVAQVARPRKKGVISGGGNDPLHPGSKTGLRAICQRER